MQQKSLLTRLSEAIDAHRATQQIEYEIRPSPVKTQTPSWLTWLLPTPGNVIFTLLVISSFLWAQSAGAINLAAPAVNSSLTIPYQGRLANASGAPFTGNQNMEFRLYNASSGGTPLWTEFWTGGNAVNVSDGLFSVLLGSLQSGLPSVVQGNSQLWLGITVGTDGEMSPRVQLGSAAYSMQALTVSDGSINSAKIQDGSVGSSDLADGSVSSAKLADGSVSIQKISDNTLIRSLTSNNAKVQFGTATITPTCDWTWITYPQPYTSQPIVLITQRESTSLIPQLVTASVSNTKFGVAKIGVGVGGSDCTSSGAIDWVAIGN